MNHDVQEENMRVLKSIPLILFLLLLVILVACSGSGGGDCEACNTPPADSCDADGRLLQYEAIGTCDDGTCVYESVPMTCVGPPGPCRQSAGTCVEDPDARCDYPALADGTPCADGLFCNGEETCQLGECESGEAVSCDDSGNPCTVAVCSELAEACETENLGDGTACDDGDPCTEPDTCQTGSCTPGTDICGSETVVLMFYMAADNDLDDFMELDWHELEAANVDAYDWLRVFVLIDQSDYAARSDSRLYEIHNGASTELDGVNLGLTVQGAEELNMTDPALVTAFIADVKAEMAGVSNLSYFLFLNDHGDGWWRKSPGGTVEPEPIDKGCCYDDDDPDDFISNAELHAAVSGQGLTLIGFDACLQGMAEVAYELRYDADYMIASQEMEGAWGWNYTALVSQFGASDDPSPENFGQIAVDTYMALCSQAGDPEGTLALYDLTLMDELATAATGMASALADLEMLPYSNLCAALTWHGCMGGYCDEYADLWDLADQARLVDSTNSAAYAAVKDVVSNLVLYSGHGTAHPESHGINVFFACDYYPYEEYSDISWAIDTGWGDMVNAH